VRRQKLRSKKAEVRSKKLEVKKAEVSTRIECFRVYF